MAVTKRDFQAVADSINRVQTMDVASRCQLALDLANYFKSQNSRFNAEQFVRACNLNYEDVQNIFGDWEANRIFGGN